MKVKAFSLHRWHVICFSPLRATCSVLGKDERGPISSWDWVVGLGGIKIT